MRLQLGNTDKWDGTFAKYPKGDYIGKIVGVDEVAGKDNTRQLSVEFELENGTDDQGQSLAGKTLKQRYFPFHTNPAVQGRLVNLLWACGLGNDVDTDELLHRRLQFSITWSGEDDKFMNVERERPIPVKTSRKPKN